MTAKIFNEECPICFSDFSDSDSHLTSCLHMIHNLCALGLTNLKCPICKSEVLNYPTAILKSIHENALVREKEVQKEDLEKLQNYIRAHEAQAKATGSERLTLGEEAHTALLYARRQGIPLVFIPSRIEIKIHSNQPLPPEGVLFCMIIQNIMLKSSMYIEEHHSDEELEDENDPFLESDLIYKRVKRAIRVHQ